MKTTVDIPAPLLEQAKAVAAEEGTTLGRLVEDGQRLVIERHGEPVGFKLRSASFRGEGVEPGVDLQRWDRVRGLIHQGCSG
ncbi:MAG: DUF2191 domain-containing protein [Thermoleophilia bacterium]|nr:DUF2191 domain-containing protein [Thermoleophilia bacterium]